MFVFRKYIYMRILSCFFIYPYYRGLLISSNTAYLWNWRSRSILHSVMIKAIDMYWIIKKNYPFVKKIRLGIDDTICSTKLEQPYVSLCHRCKFLGNNICQATFCLTVFLNIQICDFHTEKYAFDRYQSDIILVLKTSNYKLRKIICCLK